jgi:hypothetical protein
MRKISFTIGTLILSFNFVLTGIQDRTTKRNLEKKIKLDCLFDFFEVGL